MRTIVGKHRLWGGRTLFFSLCLHLRRKNTPVCEHLKQVEVEVELGGELGGIFLLSLLPKVGDSLHFFSLNQPQRTSF